MASTRFITAVGRRKTAIASVRMLKAAKPSVMVNGKTPIDYFKTAERAKVAEEALKIADSKESYEVIAHVEGGGVSAQAEALRHAISRAVTKAEPSTRKVLKAAGLMKRDPRAKERKKPGHVKARKSKQWSKR
jgi:small subunit ribosomal protein S9